MAELTKAQLAIIKKIEQLRDKIQELKSLSEDDTVTKIEKYMDEYELIEHETGKELLNSTYDKLVENEFYVTAAKLAKKYNL
jgi:hypothetical protein